MSLVQNIGHIDPFANAAEDGEDGSLIHIRNQQRTSRKSITTVQGLGPELNLKKILKALKKKFSCNGTIIEHKELGFILQLQGDQRLVLKVFLEEEGLCLASQIRMHGA